VSRVMHEDCVYGGTNKHTTQQIQIMKLPPRINAVEKKQ
jgi:hypothetical protein